MNYHMRNRMATVLHFLDKYAGNSKLNILDAGCGTGILAKEMLKRGHNVIGMDICDQMICETKKVVMDDDSKHPLAITGDVEHIPFEDNTFDVVTCVGVLEYLPEENRCIGELNRVVKNGGYIILTLPNILKIKNLLDPYYYLNRGFKFLILKAGSVMNKKIDCLEPANIGTNDTYCVKRYFKGKIKNLFKNHNIRQIDTKGLGFGPFTFWQKPLFSNDLSLKISNYLEFLSGQTFFSFLINFSNRWVICQQKIAN